ncbi:M23 family metallopeptidase [Microbacterium gubbeenense]|uniref:M23 family metallopeptidase n=1 Tax=Microbacterium gubbeenense TaxID=159896 RepID=UPI0006849377|nr:M23 family metallopeptidase [Microbacterium gubbeenense]
MTSHRQTPEAVTPVASDDSARATTRRARREQQSRTQQQAAQDVPSAGSGARAQRDAFAAAAEALNFTGEQQRVESVQAPQPSRAARRRADEPARPGLFHKPVRRFVAAAASVTAVGAVALMAFGTSIPMATAAFFAPSPVATEAAAADEAIVDASADAKTQLQGFVAGEDVQAAEMAPVEGYEASTITKIGQADGISTSGAFFQNDVSADIQYPFAVGTSMSSPFGFRWGRMHEGVDFTPGEGAPIQAIADGVVRTATEAGGAYGVNVYIDHVIDGKTVTSHYAHMQYGSLKVVEGQKVEVGDVIGNTGNTGRSYGAHLHFEIRYNGTAVDPLPWLSEHAGTHYSDDEEAQVQQQELDLLGADFSAE